MTGIITAVTSVFTAMTTWIISTINAVVPLFWTAPTGSTGTGELTFLGVLAVCGLSVSVFFLLMGVIQKFLHFAG